MQKSKLLCTISIIALLMLFGMTIFAEQNYRIVDGPEDWSVLLIENTLDKDVSNFLVRFTAPVELGNILALGGPNLGQTKDIHEDGKYWWISLENESDGGLVPGGVLQVYFKSVEEEVEVVFVQFNKYRITE